MDSSRTQRLRLTSAEKVGIINKAKRSPSMSYKDIALWAVNEFSLPTAPGKTTVCDIIRSKTDLLGRSMEKVKNAQQCSHGVLDENVMDFVMLAEADGVSLTGAMIIEHARQLVVQLGIPPEQQPRLGLSWLRRFQDRFGLKWRRAFGESDSVHMDTTAADVERLKGIISTYAVRDVFNMDESAFFYCATRLHL